MKEFLKCFIVMVSIAVLFIPVNGFTQITINSTDFNTEVGLEFVYFTASSDSITFDVESTGANHFWDFSQADTISEQGTYSDVIIDPSSAPVPNVNYVTKSELEYMPGMLMISETGMDLSSSSLFYRGTKSYASWSSDTTIYLNEPGLLLFELPFTYQSTWNSTVKKSKYTNGALADTNQRIMERTVDGWGQVQTPMKLYDCLRIKEVDQEWEDHNAAWDTSTTYYWIDGNGASVFMVFDYKTESNGNKSGGIYYSDPTGTAIEGENISQIPDQFELFQNYPNPFNPTTTISYQLPVRWPDGSGSSRVDLSIYDMLGKKVATLVSEKQLAGTHKVEWDASGLASGLYLYQLKTDNGFVQSRKLILMK